MAAGDKKDNKKDVTKSSTIKFTVDADDTGLNEMPSITKLLNRKSMKKSGQSVPVKSLPPPGSDPNSFLEKAIASAKALADERAGIKTSPPQTRPPAPAKAPIESAPVPAPFDLPKLQIPESPAAQKTASPPAAAPPRPATPPSKARHSDLSEKTGVTLTVITGRRARENPRKLFAWDRALLGTSPDPMAQALTQLIELGLSSALFLEVQPLAPGQKLASFRATASYAPKSKGGLWNGMVWDPAITPKLWSQISSLSFAELTPPESMTVASSDRNVVRTSFGLDNGEYLILILVGPVAGPRGVLALLSTKSLLDAVQSMLMLLTSEVPKDKLIKTAA